MLSYPFCCQIFICLKNKHCISSFSAVNKVSPMFPEHVELWMLFLQLGHGKEIYCLCFKDMSLVNEILLAFPYL